MDLRVLQSLDEPGSGQKVCASEILPWFERVPRSVSRKRWEVGVDDQMDLLEALVVSGARVTSSPLKCLIGALPVLTMVAR